MRLLDTCQSDLSTRPRACCQILTGAMLQPVLCRFRTRFEGQIRQLIRTKTAAKAPDSGWHRNDGTGAGMTVTGAGMTVTGAGMTDNLTTRPNRKRCRRVGWCDGGRMVEAVPLCRYVKSGSLCLLPKGGGRLVAYARLEGRHPPSGVPAYPGDAAPQPHCLLPCRIVYRCGRGRRRGNGGLCQGVVSDWVVWLLPSFRGKRAISLAPG